MRKIKKIKIKFSVTIAYILIFGESLEVKNLFFFPYSIIDISVNFIIYSAI